MILQRYAILLALASCGPSSPPRKIHCTGASHAIVVDGRAVGCTR